MKKYFLYSLKRYIPFYIICFAICLSTFVTTVASIAVENTHVETQEGYVLYYGSISGSGDAISLIVVPAIILFVFSAIIPFIANSYRYSLRSADVFNQI